MADLPQSEETKTLSGPSTVEMGDIKANGEKNGNISHEYLDYEPSGWFETTLSRVGSSTDDFFKKNNRTLHVVLYFVIHGALFGYFIGCLYYYLSFVNEPLELCSGFGSLIAVFSIIYFFLLYFYVVKRFFGAWFERQVWRKVEKTWMKLWQLVWFRWLVSTAILAAIIALLVVDTMGASERLISLLGLAIILGLGFLFSKHPGRVNWRSVLSGLLIQFIFGLMFIRWPAGRHALQCFSDMVATFLGYGVEGAEFAFGTLLVRTEGVFAFSTLPVIFFFSMLVEILFFWGALQWFCLKLGQLLRAATATTVCESVIAVGNVFLGMTESILLIKPYLYLLTPSELHVVMSSGFATVSGTILASYIGFGAEPAHLVTASIMSAPAAICFAKLLLPETKRSLTSVDNIQPVEVQDQSALSAATRGATNGIALILNIIANIVAFVAFIAFLNGVLGYLGGMLGAPDFSLEWLFGKIFIPLCWVMGGIALILNIVANIVAFVAFIAFLNGVLGYLGGMLGAPDFSLEWLFGKIFIPLCWVMGVPWEECELVGTLIGLKTVVNEFVAYQRMGEMKAQGLLSARAELIATYSLCGFTNPGSAGIMIGAIAAMAPNQRETLSSIAVRAFFAGCGICFMTACIAGLLMPDGAFG